MRRQSPEWLKCSEASANLSGGQNVCVQKATAVQHSVSSRTRTLAAEHASSTHDFGDEALLDTCESPRRLSKAGSRPSAASQEEMIRKGTGSDAAVERPGTQQPGSTAAASTAEDARQIQAPFSAAQAAPEDARAASAPASPVLAPSPLPSPVASTPKAAEGLQPSPVTPDTTDTEASGPPGADTPDAAVCPGIPAAQEASATERGLVMRPAAAKQSARTRARCDLSEGDSHRTGLAMARNQHQRNASASQRALRSSVGVLSSSGEVGVNIPVRAVKMSLLSRDTLADLLALAPVAWQRAHSNKVDLQSWSAPQPTSSGASEGADSPGLQAAPGLPGPGQEHNIEQPCRQRQASKLALRARAAGRRGGRSKSMGTGPQRAVKQEQRPVDASKADNLAGPPQRQMNKELAMLQAEGVWLLCCLFASFSSFHADQLVHADNLQTFRNTNCARNSACGIFGEEVVHALQPTHILITGSA